MLGIPTLEDARAWVGVSTSAISDEDLAQILDAEAEIQARLLELPDDPDPDTGEEATYPDPLARALLRRVQRQVAAKSLPLGMMGGDAGEWAPVGLQSWDAEIQRLEASYTVPVVA